MNDVIKIITTEGCIGCEIAKNLVNKAINQSMFTHVKLETIDCFDKNYREFINYYNIHDYPAIIFMRNNEVLFIHIGTMPVPQIIDEIKHWYKK